MLRTYGSHKLGILNGEFIVVREFVIYDFALVVPGGNIWVCSSFALYLSAHKEVVFYS